MDGDGGGGGELSLMPRQSSGSLALARKLQRSRGEVSRAQAGAFQVGGGSGSSLIGVAGWARGKSLKVHLSHNQARLHGLAYLEVPSGTWFFFLHLYVSPAPWGRLTCTAQAIHKQAPLAS